MMQLLVNVQHNEKTLKGNEKDENPKDLKRGQLQSFVFSFQADF